MQLIQSTVSDIGSKGGSCLELEVLRLSLIPTRFLQSSSGLSKSSRKLVWKNINLTL